MPKLTVRQVDQVPSRVVKDRTEEILLVRSTWDDWFKYKTLYTAHVADKEGRVRKLGPVKLAFEGIGQDHENPLGSTPREPQVLDDSYFSVGQEAEYYANLHGLDRQLREDYLDSVGDLVAKPSRIDGVRGLGVFYDSLSRYVSISTILGEFRRALDGDAELTKYNITYRREDVELQFNVDPDSKLSSNMHIVIGSNGVGKSATLQNIVSALINGWDAPWEDYSVVVRDEDGFEEGVFAGVLYVSFSPFDAFVPSAEVTKDGAPVTYLGFGASREVGNDTRRTSEDVVDDRRRHYFEGEGLPEAFADAVESIRSHSGLKRELWDQSLGFLASDPGFDEHRLSEDWVNLDSEDLKNRFKSLSDGHKSVALILTLLVESIEERSLILLDEPETHLHPPLLSAFMLAIGNLLRRQNGVAIMSTHSPVTTQEVPASCVNILSQVGTTRSARRPKLETYGEDVGVLTHEVFGLQVKSTGFYLKLQDVASTSSSLEEAMGKLGGDLGMEGRSILMSLMSRATR